MSKRVEQEPRPGLSTKNPENRSDLAQRLVDIVGSENVVVDRERLTYLSSDLSLDPFVVAELAASPGSTAEVQATARAASAAGWSIVARGAGMSYTMGHTPVRPTTLLLDMRRLASLREISVRDGYVIVEAGATWEQLYLWLSERGVRTPYWGPLSGRRATIGGTVSQGSVFFGSALHGTASSIVLGLEVVLADGTLVHTGSWAHREGSPFSRHFGPELTGLFLADSGAFGLKTALSLRTMPAPSAVAAAGFHCLSQSDALQVVEDIGRLGLACDVFAFDSFYHGLLGSLGFDWMSAQPWSVHAVVEGNDRASVDAQLRVLEDAPTVRVERIDGTVALSLRADPFGSTQLMFSSVAEGVHLPMHAVVPFSRVALAIDTIERFIESYGPELERRQITLWQLATYAAGTVVLEVSLYFSGNYRDASVNEETGTFAKQMRRELAARLGAIGATHMQLAKFYDFASVIEPSSLRLLELLKLAIDPEQVLNPGLLGL